MILSNEQGIVEGQEWCCWGTARHSGSYTHGELIKSVTLGKCCSPLGPWSHLHNEGIGLDDLQQLS